MAKVKAASTARRKPPRRLPKTVSAAEASALKAMPNLAVPTGIRDHAILQLMHRCGLRVSEVCGLHLRDVDWGAGEIRIRPEVAKGGKEAVVYLDPETRASLERWKLARRPFGAARPHLFVCVRTGARGGPLNRRLVYKMVRRRSAKAGIERRIGCHTLRHSHATELLAEGFNIREVQKLMRHSDIRTTVIYLEVRDEQLKAKIRERGQPAA